MSPSERGSPPARGSSRIPGSAKAGYAAGWPHGTAAGHHGGTAEAKAGRAGRSRFPRQWPVRPAGLFRRAHAEGPAGTVRHWVPAWAAGAGTVQLMALSYTTWLPFGSAKGV